MSNKEIIPLGKPSIFKKWLQEFLFEKHNLPARILFLLLSILFYFFGSAIIYCLASFLPVTELGASGSSVSAHNLLLLLVSLFLLLLLFLLAKPSYKQIELSEQGISLIFSYCLFFYWKTELFPWDQICSIYIKVNQNKKSSFDSFELCFADGSRVLSIPLEKLYLDSAKIDLANSIEAKASQALIEIGTIEKIRPLNKLSFTEIWLDALAAPPQREKLLPLDASLVLANKYKVIQKLGGGGQATAYLVERIENGDKVVLKESILPIYADLYTRRKALELFHAEALVLSKIKHSQIVSYIDSFVEDHRAYLVLEYIDGKNLYDYVQTEGALSISKTVNLALQMCDILKELHSMEPVVIHRDFTPHNLMMKEGEKLQLIDFAVAIEINDSSNSVAGKIAYMPAEQFNEKCTVQSDIYALGATLYYILSAQDPVPLKSSSLANLISDIPSSLDAIVIKAMAQTQEKRYLNVGEIYEDLLKLKKDLS